jgi:hypothetical protein
MSNYRTRNFNNDDDRDDEVDLDEYSPYDEGKNMDNNNDNDDDDVHEKTEAHLLPCDSEKKYILIMFEKLRKDNQFCDVIFKCNQSIFHAHRIIVSSWSRWLRALLCDASTTNNNNANNNNNNNNYNINKKEEEDNRIVALDFFDATAFSYVLDYMYGIPLMINVDVSISSIIINHHLPLHPSFLLYVNDDIYLLLTFYTISFIHNRFHIYIYMNVIVLIEC